MSDEASSGSAGRNAVDGGPHLSADAIESILSDFRSWLQQAAATPETAPVESGGFSWQALVAEFTALRQEVNLLTRAARTQQEQNTETLRQLASTVGTLEEVRSDEAEDADAEAARPLLKTLVDIYDALSLARREVQRVDTAVQKLVPQAPVPETLPGPSSAAPATRRWWQWWSGGAAEAPPAAAQGPTDQRQAADQVRQFFASVVAGYTMSLQRIDRALEQCELEPIPCVGEPFDPEYMEVVEVVAEPGRTGTEVLEEVRRGYRWHGRLFRYAQVRVARP